MPRPALADFDLAALEAEFVRWGHSPRHAQLLLRAFYLGGGRVDLEELKLGTKLRQRLTAEIDLRRSEIAVRSASSDGTLKYLIRFDGEQPGAVEAVLMPSPAPRAAGHPPARVCRAARATPLRAAGCISSQIGCPIGCDFCASTRRGLERNLTSGEIVEQFLHLREHAALAGRRLHTLVFMGMGEPLLNLDHVLAAIKRIACAELGALGWRQITVSTVGIVPEMHRLTDANLNIHLALSLHAPDDATRARLIPLNKRYPVAEIMAAARRFAAVSGRIPTIEYVLLRGVNDTRAHALALAGLMRDFRAHVNLLHYNPTGPGLSGATYQAATPEGAKAFWAVLRDAGVVAHFRRTRGDDVNAACGQLRESCV